MNEIGYLIFRRLDFILMDITKNVLRKLEKTKVPPALLPAIYPGRIPPLHSISMIYSSDTLDERATDEPSVPITSLAACLEALTQCHETINEQEASTCVISLRINTKSIFTVFFLIVQVIRIVILKVVKYPMPLTKRPN